LKPSSDAAARVDSDSAELSPGADTSIHTEPGGAKVLVVEEGLTHLNPIPFGDKLQTVEHFIIAATSRR